MHDTALRMSEEFPALGRYLRSVVDREENHDNPYDNRPGSVFHDLEEYQEIIRELCTSPWSPLVSGRLTNYLDRKAQESAGTKEHVRDVMSTVRGAILELFASPDSSSIPSLERSALEQICHADLSELAQTLHKKTFDRNRRSALEGIKNTVYLNDKGSAVDWSAFD